MATQVGERLDAFFREINPIIIGTSRSDGSLHLTPLWFEYRDGFIWINGAASRDWLEHLRRNGQVSLLVVDRQQILRRAELLGQVVTIAPDERNVQINRLSQRYSGRDFGGRGEQRITVQIELVRVAGGDGQKHWDVD